MQFAPKRRRQNVEKCEKYFRLFTREPCTKKITIFFRRLGTDIYSLLPKREKPADGCTSKLAWGTDLRP